MHQISTQAGHRKDDLGRLIPLPRDRVTDARKIEGRYPHSGPAKIIAVRPNRSENLQQNQHAFHPQNRGVQAPFQVIETEVFGGRNWRSIVSSGGVACEVSTWRKRTLVEGGAS